MEKLSKKEINRLYGKDRGRKKLRIPKNEPYKRKRKVDLREFEDEKPENECGIRY